MPKWVGQTQTPGKSLGNPLKDHLANCMFSPPEAIIVKLTTHRPEVQRGVAFVLSPLSHVWVTGTCMPGLHDFEWYIYKRRICNKMLRESSNYAAEFEKNRHETAKS